MLQNVDGLADRDPASSLLRHDRLLARLQDDRPPRDRLHQRGAHDAVRHRRARLGSTSSARCSASTVASLPEVLPSQGLFGETEASLFGGASIPLAGIAGDQQAALFGQACLDAGLGEEHLRHRQLRAAERRRPAAGAGRRPARDRRVGRVRRGRLRVRGQRLRLRRRGAVAARRSGPAVEARGRDRDSSRDRSTATTASTSCRR